MKKFDWKEYFIFSKKERRFAVWVIILVSAVTVISIYFQGKADTDSVTTLFDKELTDSIKNLLYRTDSADESKNNQDTIIPKKLFAFDPNTLDEAGWKKLGLPDRTIHTIINYRNKGGRFYKPQDVEKIYGITQAAAKELLPFISIQVNNKDTYIQNASANSIAVNTYQRKTYSTIDINTATEEEWKSLPGIGDVLSKRIVKFRYAKGGFKSVDDVADTYGLQDSVFQKIKPYLKMK